MGTEGEYIGRFPPLLPACIVARHAHNHRDSGRSQLLGLHLVGLLVCQALPIHNLWVPPITIALETMSRPSALAALFGVLLCSTCIHVCAAAEYQRPVNGDCLSVGGAGPAAGVQLYPEQFMVVGDTQSQQGLYTQASAKGVLAVGGAGHAPAHNAPSRCRSRPCLA